MDRETARQEIRQRISCEKYLTKSLRGNYICPFCGSGAGEHKTGALTVYKTNTFTCFACNKSGDVIDLYQNQTGTDYNTALNELACSLGIAIDNYKPTSPEKPQKSRQSDEKAQDNINTLLMEKTPQRGAEGKKSEKDYTDYYYKCKRELLESPEAAAAREYLHNRGISLKTAEAYFIGYDPAADPAESGHACPRLIIPTSKGHYIARRIDDKAEYKAMNPKYTKPAIFNEQALYTPGVQEVFVTEGAFDALSILEAGYTAIALNSTSNAEKLIEKLEHRRTAATLILSLDNDESGRKAAEKLKTGLQRLNISYILSNISGKYNDPNEALQKDTGAFLEALYSARLKASKKPDNTTDYIENFMHEDIRNLKHEARTGFNNLDEQAGGLYSGLYVLAAISSLGKTSFALQLADQLAASGQEIIFFSLEQSRLELISKSLARKTAQTDINNAVTSLKIRKGYAPQSVKNAIKQYKQEVQDRISIVEGNFNCNISFIGDYIRRYIERNGGRPIVFIDYLQILQPAEDSQRQNLRENIDSAVTELKRLTRELDITVFVISSVNRSNYLTPIDFESLKESGGIEYTADVIWGLQLQCLNENLFDSQNKIKEKRDRIKGAKAENPRQIELVCLKNRYGIANFSCYFNYYPANDLFKAAEDIDSGNPFDDFSDAETI